MRTCRKIVAGIDCLITEPDSTQPTTETLICMHGIGGDDASFAPQSEALADQYRVVAWNMPGYKGSARTEPQSFAQLAKSLITLIDALDVGPVHLIGQSIGGMVAQETHHRYPERFQAGVISSVILVATTSAFGGRDDAFKKAFLKARLKPLDQGMTMQQVAEEAVPSIVGRNTKQQVMNSAINSMASIDASVYRDILNCLVTFDRYTELENINCPVCLIAGGDDKNAPAATMKKMAEKLPHAEYHELPGAGHLVNLEQGESTNKIVRAFISGVTETLNRDE